MEDKTQDNEADDKVAQVEERLNNRSCKPWKERSTVEKSLAVLTLFLALIFFILLAVLLRPRNIFYGVYSDKKTCTTEVCVREAYRLLDNVDFSSDACHDFSKLVCKTYEDRPSAYKVQRLSREDEELLSTVRELLEETDEEKETETISKSRRFYHSCLRAESKNQSTGNIVRELLRKAKLTDDSGGAENVYNREKTLALLTVYGNKNPFFKFRRTPQIIYLYPGHPVLSSDVLLQETSAHINMRMKYEKLIFNALVKMDIPADDARTYAEDMVRFERKFASFAAMANCTGNSSEVSLHEMEDMFPELKWSVIVRYIYEYYDLEDEFSQKLTILLTCEDYFRKIIRLLSDYNVRTVENFIMWSFTLHYLPVLDHTFRPFYRELEQVVETHWHGNAHDDDWKICSYATTHFFNTPVAQLYNKYKYSKQTDEEIKALFEDIQSAYKDLICDQEWLDKETATECKTTIEETELVIGMPLNIRDPEVVKAMYSMMNATDDIMENLLALDKAIFAENVIGTHLTPLYSTPMDANIYYEHGALTILFGATRPPVFHVGAPRYFSYGWMGFVVAREMWNAVESSVFLDKLLPSREAKELHAMKGCLIEQYYSCQMTQKEKSKDNAGKVSAMADQTALLVAAEAYSDYVERNGEESAAPGIKMSNEKLLFINFGQLICGSSIANPLETDESGVTRFNECRLNNILGNSPKFLEAFNCSNNIAVNNNTDCPVWT